MRRVSSRAVLVVSSGHRRGSVLVWSDRGWTASGEVGDVRLRKLDDRQLYRLLGG